MDTNKKHTLPRTIILAACSLLLAGACDNYAYDGPDSDTPAREVPLNFNASIEKTEDTQSRAITSPTDDFIGNTYSFGMSITKSENGSEIFSGSSDMTATMKRSDSSVPWNWSFIDNANQSSVTPMGPEGKALKVMAYYPCVSENTKDVYTNGIPFDFSSKTDLKQTDLLYTDTIYPFAPSGDPVATIPLRFRHAYTWIVINITKYVTTGEPCMLSSVSLDNLGGGWIKNQGAIDLATGLAKDGATAGPIGVTVDPSVELSTTEVRTYNFLVPSFMDPEVSDGEIVLVLNVNGINELFKLDRVYLNQGWITGKGWSYGFMQGYKNTYDLVYNNSALGLSIQNWSSEVISGGFGGSITPPSTDNSKWIYFSKIDDNVTTGSYWPTATVPPSIYKNKYPPKPMLLNADNHLYKNYFTTVAYGGNGAYVSVNSPDPTKLPTDGIKITDDINVYTDEKVYPVIQMTKKDVSVMPVPWEDENGELVAKELCRKYNEGGHHDWRLPRATELRTVLVLVASNGNTYNDLTFVLDENQNKPYWTGTEVNGTEAWSIFFKKGLGITDTEILLSPSDKKMTASVRCVRDAQ